MKPDRCKFENGIVEEVELERDAANELQRWQPTNRGSERASFVTCETNDDNQLGQDEENICQNREKTKTWHERNGREDLNEDRN